MKKDFKPIDNLINHAETKCIVYCHPADINKIKVVADHFVSKDRAYVVPKYEYGPDLYTDKDLFREIRTLRKLVKSLRR